jgi:hypothetical protein
VLGSAVAFGALETVAAFAPTFWTTALLLLPTGFFMIYFAQATNQRIQLGTDAWYRGRVMSLFILVFLGTTPVGAVAVGWLSERFGPRAGIAVGGVVSLFAALVALAWQLRRTGARIGLRLRPLPRLYVIAPAEGSGRALAPAGQ